MYFFFQKNHHANLIVILYNQVFQEYRYKKNY